MAHAQKQDFVFRRNGRVHLNRQGRQFSQLLAAEVCASAVVMLDTPFSEVVWRVLATHSIPQFTLHFPSRASPCPITFQLDSTNKRSKQTEIRHLKKWDAESSRRSLVGIVGSNPAGGMDVCLLWVLCVVRGLCVGMVNSSREVLPSVVCTSVIVNPGIWGRHGPLGAVAPWYQKKDE